MGARQLALEVNSKMSVPISQMWTVSTYVLKKKLSGIRWC